MPLLLSLMLFIWFYSRNNVALNGSNTWYEFEQCSLHYFSQFDSNVLILMWLLLTVTCRIKSRVCCLRQGWGWVRDNIRSHRRFIIDGYKSVSRFDPRNIWPSWLGWWVELQSLVEIFGISFTISQILWCSMSETFNVEMECIKTTHITYYITWHIRLLTALVRRQGCLQSGPN